jgi:hypothetical protein
MTRKFPTDRQHVFGLVWAVGALGHGLRGFSQQQYESSLFARLISHQPTVLFSQNEPATSNQPQPASSTLLSEQTSTSHQPPANRTG